MKLADALLCLVLDAEAAAGEGCGALCGEAIAGGVDIIQAPAGERLGVKEIGPLAAICRREDALFLVADDTRLAEQVKADGVLLTGPQMEVGLARAAMRSGSLVGLVSRTPDEAALALHVGADLILHYGGAESRACFEALKGRTTAPLFAAGLQSVEEARAVVATGIYRLCLDVRTLQTGAVRELISSISRLLGRIL